MLWHFIVRRQAPLLSQLRHERRVSVPGSVIVVDGKEVNAVGAQLLCCTLLANAWMRRYASMDSSASNPLPQPALYSMKS